MRVKMKTGLSGPNYSLSPGDEHEFADYEAERLIRAGYAEAAADANAARSKKAAKEKPAEAAAPAARPATSTDPKEA